MGHPYYWTLKAEDAATQRRLTREEAAAFQNRRRVEPRSHGRILRPVA